MPVETRSKRKADWEPTSESNQLGYGSLIKKRRLHPASSRRPPREARQWPMFIPSTEGASTHGSTLQTLQNGDQFLAVAPQFVIQPETQIRDVIAERAIIPSGFQSPWSIFTSFQRFSRAIYHFLNPTPWLLLQDPARTIAGTNSNPQWRTWINILLPQDPENRHGPWEMATIDTGAQHSVVYESGLKKHGLDTFIHYGKRLGAYKGLAPGMVKVVGWINLSFVFDGVPRLVYVNKVDVLQDNTTNAEKPNFNILLGRSFLNKHNLVTIDTKRIPHLLWAKKEYDAPCSATGA